MKLAIGYWAWIWNFNWAILLLLMLESDYNAYDYVVMILSHDKVVRCHGVNA